MELGALKGDFLPPLPGVRIASITPPPVNPNFIVRTKLLQLLNHPAPYATVIVAPGGFGKTSLAAQWAAEKPEETMWITLNENLSATEFLKKCISSARRVIPNFAVWAENSLEKELDHEAISIKIVNEISALAQHFRVIWDGTDRLSPELFPLIQNFLNLAPLNLSTLSLRRTLPDVSYSRAASLNAFLLLTAADLKFSDSEISALAAINKIDLKNPLFTQQLNLAGGWPVGLQLLIQKLNNESNGTILQESILTTQGSLIVNNALESLDKDSKEILENLVFLDEFSSENIENITASKAKAEQALRLVKSGVFLYQVSESPDLFKMQPLIKEYLISSLKLNTEKFTTIGKKSAELLFNQGQTLQAMKIFEEIGEEEKAFDLARRSVSELIFSANDNALKKFKEIIGERLGIGPAGPVGLEIYANVAVGNNESSFHDLETLESMIAGTETARGAADEITLMKSRLAFTFGKFNESIELFWAAHRHKMSEYSEKVKGIPKYALTGIEPALDSAFLTDDVDSLWKLSDLIQASNIANNSAKNLNWLTSQALAAHSQGRFNDAYSLGKSAIAVAETRKAGGAFIPYSAFYCVADSLREFGKEEQSLALFDQILSFALKYKQYPWAVAFYSRKALVYSQMSQNTQALLMIAQARAIASEPLVDPRINQIIDDNEIVIRVQTHDTTRITELLTRMPGSITALAFRTAFLASQNLSKANEILDQFPEISPRHKVVKKIISLQVFTHDPTLSHTYLEDALDIASAVGMRQIFIQGTLKHRELILTLAEKKPTVYLQGLASEIRKQLNASKNHGGTGTDEPLTKRELEILRRLATGLPLNQISVSLHISINTMKTHLKNIYRKMNVDSREEAVTRGKTLALF
jgi:ATP/maltotriose-dependent transcriptional regulator MalT